MGELCNIGVEHQSCGNTRGHAYNVCNAGDELYLGLVVGKAANLEMLAPEGKGVGDA